MEEAVYLHNLRPLDDIDSATAPSNLLYQYTVRIREVDHCRYTTEGELAARGPYHDGDEVWVKLANARDKWYEAATVTRMLSEHAAEVNRVPRHIRDLHLRADDGGVDATTEARGEDDDQLLIRSPEGVNGREEQDSHASDDEEEGDADIAVAGVEMPRHSDRIRRLRECAICK